MAGRIDGGDSMNEAMGIGGFNSVPGSKTQFRGSFDFEGKTHSVVWNKDGQFANKALNNLMDVVEFTCDLASD